MPQWIAGAQLTGDAEGLNGRITFQQLPYRNDVKVTINASGLPAGKHALHIHTYGDLSEGCKSTGDKFSNNFVSCLNQYVSLLLFAMFRRDLFPRLNGLKLL